MQENTENMDNADSCRGTTFLVGPFLGPALAGYILDGSSWKVSFNVLAGLYGASTLMILVLARETFYRRGQNTQETSHLKSIFGIGNTGTVPKVPALVITTKDLITHIFKLPLLLVGRYF
jgi:MFS family permease